MSLPYMPWFASDYLGKTAHLTLIEDAIYRRLLDHLWRQPKCQAAYDLNKLARILRLHGEGELAALEAVISEFMEHKNGVIFQKNQMEIFKKAKSVSFSRSQNGKKGGRPRKSAKTQAQQGEREESYSLANGKQTESIQNQNKNKKNIQKKEAENGFENFWKNYPKRHGSNPKYKAEQSFAKLEADDQARAIEVAEDYANWCEENNQDPRYIPQAVTWLSQRRWKDVLDPSQQRVVVTEKAKADIAKARAMLNQPYAGTA